MWVFSGSSITEGCGISRVMTQGRLLSLRCKWRAYILQVFVTAADEKLNQRGGCSSPRQARAALSGESQTPLQNTLRSHLFPILKIE